MFEPLVRSWPLLLLATVLGACSPALPDQVVKGRWVRYHYWADQGAPCPEAVEQIDRLVDQLAIRFERPPPADFRIDYYRVRNLGEVRAHCRPSVTACAPGNTVFSTAWTHDHEITHAFLSRLGRPPDLFAEGIAVAMGCGPARWVGDELEPVDLEPLVDNSTWLKGVGWEVNYPVAGSFTRWLIVGHGMSAFLRFYESTPYEASRSQVEAHFRDAFGVELSDALTQWRDGSPSRDGEYCMPLDDKCDAQPDVVADGSTSAQTVSCVDRVSVLEVGAAPVTQLRFTAERKGRSVNIRPCDATGSPPYKLVFAEFNLGLSTAIEGRWTELWVTLKPGRYSLTVERTWDGLSEEPVAPPGGSASVQASGHPEVFETTCPVEPITITDDTWSLAFLKHDPAVDPDGGVLLLRPQSDRRFKLLARGLAGPASACSNCSSLPTSCKSIAPGSSFLESLQGPTSLRLQPQADAGALFVQLLLEGP